MERNRPGEYLLIFIRKFSNLRNHILLSFLKLPDLCWFLNRKKQLRRKYPRRSKEGSRTLTILWLLYATSPMVLHHNPILPTPIRTSRYHMLLKVICFYLSEKKSTFSPRVMSSLFRRDYHIVFRPSAKTSGLLTALVLYGKIF